MAVAGHLNVTNLMLSQQRHDVEFYVPARVGVFIADLGRDDDQLIERTGTRFGFNDPADQDAGRFHAHTVRE
jgi:hypothetical protein